MNLLLGIHMLATLLPAQPLPLIDPEFNDGLGSWVVSGSADASSMVVNDGGGSPDTSVGGCVHLVSGATIETRAPILRSMAVGQSLHLTASLVARSGEESSVRFDLIDSSGAIYCSDLIVPSTEWSRYKGVLMSKVDAPGPLRLRISSQSESSDILLDNLSIELVGSVPAGFQSLVDGDSLEGWVGDMDGYVVEDGIIRVKPAPGGDLRTSSEFQDFQLSFEFLLQPGSNNGIAVRSPLQGDAAYEGMEIQVIDNFAQSHAALKPWQYHGSAYGLMPAKRGWMLPPGQWNRQSIRLVGRRLTVVLNGHVILDGDIDDALREGAPSGAEHPGVARSRGHIGFCGHGSEVAYREIRIRPIDVIGNAPGKVVPDP